jgi:hypothetical protein
MVQSTLSDGNALVDSMTALVKHQVHLQQLQPVHQQHFGVSPGQPAPPA